MTPRALGRVIPSLDTPHVGRKSEKFAKNSAYGLML